MADWQERLTQAGHLFDQGKMDEACVICEDALRQNPHAAMAYQILGMTQVKRNEPYRAMELLHHALDLQPDLVPARCQLGVAHTQLGQGDEALKCFEKAIAFSPNHIASRFNRAQLLLQQGNFQEGWLEYEWRWMTGEVTRANIPRPRWDGKPLQGRSLLICTEQGLGDTMQFLRFFEILKQQGARLVFACQKPMHHLLKNCPWVDEWFPIDEEAPITFEWYTTLLSLPELLKVHSLEDIPLNIPYIFPESKRVEHWRAKLDELPGLKVGLNWQGKPSQGRDHLRSMPLEKFAPIAQVEGITLINLHKGSGEEQIEQNKELVPLTVFEDLDADGAFLDTAALMKNLDLIISTDTSTVHLAGAMGCPVWVPLTTACDWRFMFDRTDSPWYPTMRLFRQQCFQVWEPVIEEITQALREFQKTRTTQPSPPINANSQDVPLLPVSVGELLDKITILEIKSERIDDEEKLANVRRELEMLKEVFQERVKSSKDITRLFNELKTTNEQLWEIEDDIRRCESESDFGDQFIGLARSVYKQNDHRAELKRRINQLTGSLLMEEKSYVNSEATVAN